MAKELMVYGKKRIEKGTDGTSQVRYDCFFEHNGEEIELVPEKEGDLRFFSKHFQEGPYELFHAVKTFVNDKTGQVVPYDEYRVLLVGFEINLKVRYKSDKTMLAFLIRESLKD